MTAYAFLHVAISFLIIGSLALMVSRIYLPWVRQPKEAVLLSYVVPFRLRVRMQRANIYGLAVLLVLGTIGHWIAPTALLLALGSTLLILAVPVRYTLTTTGIMLGRTPMYAWTMFGEMEPRPARVHLVGTDDWRPLDVWLPRPPDDARALVMIRRCLPAVAPKRSKRRQLAASRAAVTTRR
jgi:hypothetical protein